MKKSKFAALLIAFFVLVGAGCSSKPFSENKIISTEAYSDLSVCGEFPTSLGDGGPTSRHYVCRDSVNGECYYKRISSEQIKGCDPEFDKNPYGNEECFKDKTDFFTFRRGDDAAGIATPEDSCSMTTQVYFESKVTK